MLLLWFVDLMKLTNLHRRKVRIGALGIDASRDASRDPLRADPMLLPTQLGGFRGVWPIGVYPPVLSTRFPGNLSLASLLYRILAN